MPKNTFVLILELFLLLQFAKPDSDYCTTEFEKTIQKECSYLSVSGVQTCEFIDNECKNVVETCDSYAPTENFDENICKGLALSDKTKKCTVETTEEGGKKCVQTNKKCSELNAETCFDLDLGTDRRCVLKEGKCQEHFNSCGKLTSETECIDNIPSNIIQKCVWSGSECKPKNRKCEDYVTYSEKGKISLCEILLITEGETNKICILNEEKCEEVFQKCEGLPEAICEKTIPVDDSEMPYTLDNKNKCVWDGECKTVPRICSDYKKRPTDFPAFCRQLKAEDDTNKFCLYDSEKDTCTVEFKDCNAYNKAVAEADRKKEECNAILRNDFWKCSFDEATSTCKEVKKECNEMTDKTLCNILTQTTAGKKCIFVNEACREDYQTCEDYTGKEKTECEAIFPYLVDKVPYKCVYSTDNGCESEKISTCGNYTGNDLDLCKAVLPANSDSFKCVLKDNKCIQSYKDCYSHQGYNEESCNSIVLDKEYEKCVFENYHCFKKTKLCNEYKGTNASECRLYSAANNSYVCVMENNKCVEKINFVFKLCEDYKGHDKSICEEIQPWTSGYQYNSVDYSSKCVYNEEDSKCEKQAKNCSEAKDERECYLIKPSDKTKKRCAFVSNTCVEQYTSCQYYEESGEVLDKDTCESIAIENLETHKCVYASGTNGGKATCTKTPKSCSDFKIELLSKICLDSNTFDRAGPITNYDYTTQCTFKDNVCSKEVKSCLDLTNLLAKTKEVCEKAKTFSSNKDCIYDEIGQKCLLINNKEAQNNYAFEEKNEDEDSHSDANNNSDKTDNNSKDDSNDNKNDENGNDDEDNNTQKIYLNKLLLLLLSWTLL